MSCLLQKMFIRVLFLVPFVAFSGPELLLAHFSDSNTFIETKNDSVDKHLFDFDELVFDQTADKIRRDYEAEFIKFGKSLEANPVGYIRHVLSLFEFTAESKLLMEYKDAWVWNTGLFGYRYFQNQPTGEIWTQKEYLREAYLLEHISRDGDNISRLWGHFGYLVVEVISPYMLKGKLERGYVLGLIDAWTCITEKKKYEKKLEDIYAQITREKPDCDQLYSYMAPLMCDDLNTRFERPVDSYYGGRDIQWIYSFWVRRYHEGNADVTLEILKSLL